MKSLICLYGGPVFDGQRMISEASVWFDREGVIAVTKGVSHSSASLAIDVRGRLIAPGLVDLHCDAMEKCMEMRPGVLFDADFALLNLDQRLAASGITTFCHALSFADNELGLRSPEEAEKLVERITHTDRRSHCAVRHRIHARFEIGSERSAQSIERLIDAGLVDLLSFMDHTPGQGQFKTLQSYVDFYTRNYQLVENDVVAMVDRKKSNRSNAWKQAARLAEKARASGIPILSHDDDTPEKVALVRRLHAGGSEFPIALSAARAARASGMRVFMGAPNLVRGTSTNGHLKASETVARGLCDGLISDYYPECLLQTPFLARDTLDVGLSQALALVTSGPADYLNDGLTTGQLTPGAPADLVVIDTGGVWKKVVQTWVGGCCVYRTDKHRNEERGEAPIH
jgi:alpha-D-ribose 1-methylphosphonate 5-triphosphate diphosphatase